MGSYRIILINPRLTEPLFVTQLTGVGWLTPRPSDFQNLKAISPKIMMQEHFYALYVFTVQSTGAVATTPPPTC